MPTKAKENGEKTTVLKGQEAEDKILEYMKKMNRPFGAVDVCANLKGAVPKASTQKVLAALAEKGLITQKPYGKTVFFVASQAHLDEMPQEHMKALESEHKAIEEENKLLTAEVRSLNTELSKLKSTPTNDELQTQIAQAQTSVERLQTHLGPLRSGIPLISSDEINQIDTNWVKWRAEWVKRRKIFMTFWQLVSDSLPPQDAASLAEDIGVEYDSTEHADLERSKLCTLPARKK